MYRSANDEATGLCVGLFWGDHNTDDDFERYVTELLEAAELAKGADRAAFILVARPENPPPSAMWRKRIAEATKDVGQGMLFGLVTPSTLLRGVLTAMNWMRRPLYEFETFSTFDEAVDWVEQKRGRPAPMLPVLLKEVEERSRADA